ncbi:SGO_0107 family LPXTG-anchored pilin-like protein [Streptococcus gordonii]|uniref:SGO_0107 family LPXTG-anchored pilin-like protein n=1 Tax=Streptococcus gordonii TaxID=1302 RepID=UPI0005A26D83|nr:SGO_0107 family LPXTG-anchored pilin-like protein [Streptococcus gordonii]MBZ2138400.1 LPXTG cell wall anchor domain-containing protein [Streptococcus gordonii]QGS44489.1 LPXTG cell wall anchor domain-containing protein [Streptococcus gordonii]VEE20191.1 LPXTG cell wall surface protein [Streptococcus gordonii]
MKKMNKKLFHAFMTLLLIVSVFIPLLKTSYTVKAEELPSNNYTMTTSPTINNNRLVDGAKYGEGKFYLNPTYKFDNSATLKNGDFMVYKVPKEFKVERDITTDIYAKDGATKIAELQTNAATNSATVTITNEEYFKNLTEDRELTALFTVVWADDVELNKEYSIDIPGAGTYRLTRIVPDDDPTGYTKWGVQDADDPNYVNWRIRINRYVKPVTGVKIEDTIPEGQVLASEITGYYFTEWNKAEARPRLDASHVNVTGTNSFTITPNGNGDLSTQGLYVLYRTRLTAPVDNTTKKAFNNVKVTTSDGVYDVDGFASLTTTEGIGSGARPSEVEFEVTKQLNGGTLKGDEFIFQLIDPDGKVVETAKNNKDGQVKFKAIKFSKAGTFKYQIKEVDEKEPGYVYDNKTINAEVTVTDVFGEKFASVKYDNKVFVNSYSAKPTTATIEAIKVLKGRALEADKYEFELKDSEGNLVGTAKNKADGSVVFPAIEYTTAGPHTYTITEKAGNEPGVTYDTASHTVTVDVADNGRGQLEATVPAEKPVFTNTYAAKPGKKIIEAKKVLNGKELEADKYEFELKENDKVVATAKNTADGSISFPEIEYTEAGTYTYTMSEKAGNEAGVTYDKTSHTVTVDVVDNGQGQLEATVTSEKPVFTNTYAAKPGKAVIEAKKVLNGKALEADKYEFELKEDDKVVGTAKNKADGSVVFPAIEYTAAGPHTYTITEKAGNEENVTYDTTVHTVTVDVADNGQGQLVATITSEQPVFTNTYTKPAPAADTITIEASKTLVGKELEAGKYEFELKEGDKVIGTATNAADGKVVFPSITYTEAGKHTYTVAEKAGNEENVTYDTTVHTVTVEVADNGQGKLVSTITGNKPAFVNKYTAPTPPPTPNPQQPTPATATIQANKVLTGKELKDGQFEFELTYQGNVVDTAKNKADGSVTFKAQSFTSPGKYEYTITEKVGNEAGVTYDKAVHKVTVEVAYDTNGKLVATVTGNGPTFTNTYAAKTPPTSSGEKPKPSGDKHEDPKKEEPKKEVKKELPKTGTAESSAFSVLVGFLLLVASVFLYRTKKVN